MEIQVSHTDGPEDAEYEIAFEGELIETNVGGADVELPNSRIAGAVESGAVDRFEVDGSLTDVQVAEGARLAVDGTLVAGVEEARTMTVLPRDNTETEFYVRAGGTILDSFGMEGDDVVFLDAATGTARPFEGETELIFTGGVIDLSLDGTAHVAVDGTTISGAPSSRRPSVDSKNTEEAV